MSGICGPSKQWYDKNYPFVTDGLVLHLDASRSDSYPGSGSTWYDISPSGLSGTLINSPTYDSSGYFQFNGSSSYVNFGNPSQLQLISAITIESWIYFSSSSYSLGNIINKNDNDGYRFRLNGYDNRGIDFFDRGGTNTISSVSAIPNGVWRQVTVTGNSSGLKIYINGVLDRSGGSAYSPSSATSGNFLVGACVTYSEYFDGRISIIRVYNRALTDTEILNNFNTNKNRFGL